MFTSRAEYRLLLRRDNADLRLTEIGHALGLVGREQFERMVRKREGTVRAQGELLARNVVPNSGEAGTDSVKAWQYLKRPEVSLRDLLPLLSSDDPVHGLVEDPDVAEQIDILAKYEGYVKRQLEEVERFAASENVLIPDGIEYSRIQSLSSEAREKLSKVRPRSIGQASRIAGVTRSDLSILTLYVR